ncbi:hypothetical protein Ancab_032000 [Ancistrocladus abbreviatus]
MKRCEDRKRKMEDRATNFGSINSVSASKIARFKYLCRDEIEEDGRLRISTQLKLFSNPLGHSANKAQEASEFVSVLSGSTTVITSPNSSNSVSEVPRRLEGANMRSIQLNDPWKIKKQLTSSDLNHLSRLLIRKKEVGSYILPELGKEAKVQVHSKNGLGVMAWDCDTETEHQLTFQYWKSSKSFVLKGGWSEFVKRRGLTTGDEIGMFWDRLNRRFSFSVLTRAGRAPSSSSH